MPVNSFDHYPLSWKPNLSKLSRPYYLSLTQDLEQKILDGELPEGTRLPPQRELADYLDLNYSTITRVYNYCRHRGLIYGVTGRGTFVSPHAVASIMIEHPSSPMTCIEMGFISGFPEITAPVETAMEKVLHQGYVRNLLSYEHPFGFPHQRLQAADWLSLLGVHTDMEHIIIFQGAENALTTALFSLFHPGDRIAVDVYTYSNFILLAKMKGLTLVPVAGDREGMLADELDRICRKLKIQGIYLMPSCSNPSNVMISPARKEELAYVIKKNHLTLIEDDLYAWLRAEEGKDMISLHDLVGCRSFYIASLTKCLCPGLRIAYGALTDDIKDTMKEGFSSISIKTSSLDAEIINEMLTSGAAAKLLHQKAVLAQKSCALFDSLFPHVSPQPSSYFRWLPIPGHRSFEQVESELLTQGIHVYHSGRFLTASHEESSFLRVSLCSAGNSARLRKGLSIIRNYIKS
ncbi:PLP-dependent aminotransferase family protein [Dialister sp.]|uniref:aminotransferase-like domain-containing protein n=1 Tax=Dialister sp. TaxID=1955814 RepID=UPI003F12AD29